LETEIEAAESHIEALSQRMNDPAVAADYEKAHQLFEEKEEAEAKLLTFYEEYERLTSNDT